MDGALYKTIVGGGYDDFWDFCGRYRVCKGSRASKKSKTTALNFIDRLMEYPQANLLVVRKVYSTLRDSCYAELCWAINRLGLGEEFTFRLSPLEITRKQTGQKIYFRGLDDPIKITSITVENGCLCWLWIEEAYEVTSEADFDMLDESIRGQVPEGLFKQVTITLNPWNERHWIKKRFFDTEDSDVLAKTTNYTCNEWLDDADLAMFERMRLNNPRRYRVAGLGEWGIAEGLVYENWEEKDFDLEKLNRDLELKHILGLDFGYANDPTAIFYGVCDTKRHLLYVVDEVYKKGMSNEAIYNIICERGWRKAKIVADSAEPKSIDRLRELGVPRIRGARKGGDSIRCGIDLISDYKLIIRPKCVNFLTEVSNYMWEKDRFGNMLNRPCDSFNHLMDAMRYAMEDMKDGDLFSFE
jgi:phage terminase large subunit